VPRSQKVRRVVVFVTVGCHLSECEPGIIHVSVLKRSQQGNACSSCRNQETSIVGDTKSRGKLGRGPSSVSRSNVPSVQIPARSRSLLHPPSSKRRLAASDGLMHQKSPPQASLRPPRTPSHPRDIRTCSSLRPSPGLLHREKQAHQRLSTPLSRS